MSLLMAWMVSVMYAPRWITSWSAMTLYSSWCQFLRLGTSTRRVERRPLFSTLSFHYCRVRALKKLRDWNLRPRWSPLNFCRCMRSTRLDLRMNWRSRIVLSQALEIEIVLLSGYFSVRSKIVIHFCPWINRPAFSLVISVNLNY